MRINNTNILVELTKNNFYKNQWKYIDTSQNSVNYLLQKLNIVIKIHKLDVSHTIETEFGLTRLNNTATLR